MGQHQQMIALKHGEHDYCFDLQLMTPEYWQTEISFDNYLRCHQVNVLSGKKEMLMMLLEHFRQTWCGGTCPHFTISAPNLKLIQVENLTLWRKYAEFKRHMVMEHKKLRVQLDRIDPRVSNHIAGAFTHLHLSDVGLDRNINEEYLFHGTTKENLPKILNTGFDFRYARDSGYYGQGTYFASQMCKSMQYTRWRKGSEKGYIIIAKVALGRVQYTQQVCQDRKKPDDGHDSVVANEGPVIGHGQGLQAHQEFVIFDKNQAYPAW